MKSAVIASNESGISEYFIGCLCLLLQHGRDGH